MKTAQWVLDLLDNWLNAIEDQATLDELTAKIEDRKRSLGWETKEEEYKRLIARYRTMKEGEPLSTLEPLPHDDDKRKRINSYWQKCFFYHWQPRAHVLWVRVDWKTERSEFAGRREKGKARKVIYLIRLNQAQIKGYQPSGTELKVRLKAIADAKKWKK